MLYFSSGDVAGQFIPAPSACSGNTLTFRCTVAGIGTTLWRVNGSSNLCTLVHLSTSTDTCGPSGRIDTFTAIPETGFGTSGPSYSSSLSGTASSALDGTLVECFGPVSSLDSGNRVGSSTIQVLGKIQAACLTYHTTAHFNKFPFDYSQRFGYTDWPLGVHVLLIACNLQIYINLKLCCQHYKPTWKWNTKC